jgi:trimeric autotransporter adhesin
LTSVALGFHVSAGDGSFVFGDRSSSTDGYAAGVNQFLVRAYGGLGFNSGPGIGCDLPAGQGAWACTSSRLAKEGFEDVDGEAVLGKLAGIKIQSWRYLNTSAKHVGPFAEDFRAAFGLGDGPTKIATVDEEGISLVAVQALERRTAKLQADNDELRAELAALREQVQKLSR